MIEKNSVDIERITSGSTDIKTVYQGTTEVWSSAPKYLFYEGLSDTNTTEPNNWSKALTYYASDWFTTYSEDSISYYTNNNRYYNIAGYFNYSDYYENNGLKDLSVYNISVPSKYKRLPIYGLGMFSLSSIYGKEVILKLKKPLCFDKYSLGILNNYSYPKTQPTATTFANDRYYIKDNNNIYTRAKEYQSGVYYYVSYSTINNLHLTEYQPDTSAPDIKYTYARLNDNDYAICLGFTGETKKYLLSHTSGITIKIHPDCLYIYDDAFNQNFGPNIADRITGLNFNNSKIVQIGYNAFNDCKYLQGTSRSGSIYNLNLPSSLRWIGEAAFKNCFSEVTYNVEFIIYGAELIDRFAFSGCKKLHRVTLNVPGVIKQFAFSSCESLEYIIMVGGYTQELESNIFYNCTNLKYANNPDTDSIFDESKYKKYTDNNECYLGTYLIYGHYKYDAIIYEIQAKTTHIAGRAFVTTPASTTEKVDSISYGNIIQVKFPSTLKSIGEWAFGSTFGNTQWSNIRAIIFDGLYKKVTGTPLRKVKDYYTYDAYGYLQVDLFNTVPSSSTTYYERSYSSKPFNIQFIGTGAFSICAASLFSNNKYINLSQAVPFDNLKSLPILYNKSSLTYYSAATTLPKLFVESQNPNLYNLVKSSPIWNSMTVIRDEVNMSGPNAFNYAYWDGSKIVYYRMFDFPTSCEIIRSFAFGNSKATFESENSNRDTIQENTLMRDTNQDDNATGDRD